MIINKEQIHYQFCYKFCKQVLFCFVDHGADKRKPQGDKRIVSCATVFQANSSSF